MFNLKEIISSIADVGQKLFNKSNIKKNDLDSILSLCDDLLSNKGAVFGITVARDITSLYQELSNENKFNFFREMNFFEESVSTICQSGYNFNKKNYLYEVNIVSKKLKKNGFFEKLFHFFN